MGKKLWLICGSIFATFAVCFCTMGYYKICTPYGTGDTMLMTWTAHDGPNYNHPQKKWIIECMDGEAVVGILDNGDDYTRIWYVWCKFMFPYKPPAQGVYPYYPHCHVRNFTTQYFCYQAVNHNQTVDTFITAFYGHQFNWPFNRQGTDDLAPYKCCKTPIGYHLDYSACYYQPTHDSYWEYYDSPAYFVVYCATGYVATGLARKQNPYTFPDYHIEWIQCCRLGFGVPAFIFPPANATTQAPYYNNVKAYSYARASPNNGIQSRFATDPDLDKIQEEDVHSTENAGPTSGDNWPTSGIKIETPSSPQSQETGYSVDTSNSGLYAHPQLDEFFSQEGGSSTVGPVTLGSSV